MKLKMPRSIISIGLLFLVLNQVLGTETDDVREKRELVQGGRVIGGRVALKNEFPYMIAISQEGRHGRSQFCGATLYSPKVVITAAHCLEDGHAKPMDLSDNILYASAGEHDLHEEEGKEQHRKIVKITLHPGYAGTLNDIALAEVDQPFELNDVVQPLKIAKAGSHSSGDAILSGWGLTEARKAYGPKKGKAQVLMAVPIVIVPRDKCDSIYKSVKKSEVFQSPKAGTGLPAPSKTLICAGILPNGGKDSCQGDSGGPLACYHHENGVAYGFLCGVVSTGYGCGLRLPGLYSDVAQFADWIKENAGEQQ